jgi:hypothetical protein
MVAASSFSLSAALSVHKTRSVWYTIVMKKAARPAVYVKKIPEFVSHTAVVGTVFALSLSLSLSLS